VKQFLLGTVATLSGPRWIESVCADVTSTGPGPAVIRLKVGDIMMTNDSGQVVPALASVGGSVQYEFNGSFAPFTLTRVEANRFVALDSKCTHFGCGVGRYKEHHIGEDNSMPPQPIYATYMLCPCHGSRYDIEGRVFRDSSGQSTEPAQRDLPQYEFNYDALTDTACITIPGVISTSIPSVCNKKDRAGKSASSWYSPSPPTRRMRLIISPNPPRRQP
jgi:Rieske Fe-S protein